MYCLPLSKSWKKTQIRYIIRNLCVLRGCVVTTSRWPVHNNMGVCLIVIFRIAEDVWFIMTLRSANTSYVCKVNDLRVWDDCQNLTHCLGPDKRGQTHTPHTHTHTLHVQGTIALQWQNDAASVRIKLKVPPATQRHHRERVARHRWLAI
jgi:hypothetical protein